MAGNSAHDKLDPSAHRRTYKSIMKWSSEHGVPFSLALATFFTLLVMREGIGVAFIGFVVVYVFVHVISRTFFSQH
ncbi:MAG: hypothetical protein K2Q06_08410 [Parvularculaceae bacterium]|nr:hypothetical protein [Parvularculaceae bacterium]